MADQRLVWRQLTAPDLSAASQAMARAGAAFSDGMNTGSSLLAKYAEGQQAKADDAILGEIAGLKDEAAFDEFVSGGGLAGRNISQGMRDHILGMRSNFVNDDGVRARTDGTRASTENTRATMGINLAREARSAAEWQDGMARRDAERAAAGDIEAARAFSSQYGDTVGPITEYKGVQGEVYKGLLDRGIPEHIAQGFMMNFQDESGFNAEATEATPNVHGTRGKGLYQLTGDRRAAYEARYGNDYSINNQLDFMMSELGGSESAAWKAIQNSRTAGEAGAAIVSKFLRPAEQHRAARSAAYLGSSGGTPSYVSERASPVQAARQELLNTGLFTAAEVDQMMAGSTQAGKTRSEELLAADQAAQKEAEAQAAMAALLDPNNLSGGDMARGILSDPNMSAQERMRVLDTASGLAEANPGVLAPDPTKDPNSALALSPDGQPDTRVEDIATGIKQDLGASLAARPQTQLVDDIDKFSQEDPAQALESVLGLGSDRESDTWFRDYDQNELRNLIRDYAKEFGVDEPTAAAAMRQAFERDPWGRNTMENRFDKDRVGSIIADSLSQDQISGAREDRRRASQLQTRADSIVQRINLLQTQARKGGDRSAIAQEIANLTVELTAIRSEASQLFGTPSAN